MKSSADNHPVLISHRLLLVDVGNTSITVGAGHGGRIVNVQRVPTKQCRVASMRAAILAAGRGASFSGAVLCSVVPGVVGACKRAIERTCGVAPLVVSHRVALGVRIDYPKPKTIGADRLANAAGAVARYGCPVIVADFGTALTFDIVSDVPAYIGGVIAPGLSLMIDYLADRTALLPRIRLHGSYGVVGKSTEGAMRMGAQLGYRGMVREIVGHIRKQEGMHGATLCATGGYARWVLQGLDLPIRIDPWLTLYGLQVIHALNP